MPKPNTIPVLDMGKLFMMSGRRNIIATNHTIIFIAAELSLLGCGSFKSFLSARVGIAHLERELFLPNRLPMEIFDNVVTD